MTLAGVEAEVSAHPPMDGRPFGIYSVLWRDAGQTYLLTIPYDVGNLVEAEKTALGLLASLR